MNAAPLAKIDRYLLNEMNESECDDFEQEMMSNDALFYEVAERENDLVDSFVQRALDGPAEKRFRESLSKFPARRAKIANASLLKTYIGEVRSAKTAVETAAEPWYRRLGFAFRAPALATAAMGLVLTGTVAFLLIQNRNLNQQVAALDSRNRDLNILRQREAELEAELEVLRSAGGELTSDLESERERRAALESELIRLRGQIEGGSGNVSPIVPTIATLVLRPVGTRGGPGSVRKLRLDNERRVALKIELPAERSDEAVSVKLNDIPVASGIRPVRDLNGVSNVSVTVTSDSFRNGLNRVEVFDSNSQNVVSFAVLLERGPIR